ncbi:uncharacterized protein LOC117318133 isoform X2 [Pecten maximus]|uniref:uncharacterized protein LOC117318133 isoform X2 n=1 Tax=Pecten maximus TaxID=6579 RepID=UPI001458692C|nr:uncharacterized protein LOC117318133 isoform X2 [Pecten maximus]
MHFEETKTGSGKCTSVCSQGINKLLLIVVVCLAVSTIILTAILIWKESSRDTGLTSTTLNQYYPGYFRTEAEQLEFEQKSNTFVPVESNITSPLNCQVKCFRITGSTPLGGLVRRRRQAPDTSFHGCCQSSISFISPSFRNNLLGVSREFVILEGAQQFFQTGSCQFAVGCTGCTCMISQEINTAVVYKAGETADTSDDIDDTEIDLFYFQKCCKCVNTG